MSEICHRCGKSLPDSSVMTIGGPRLLTRDDVGWHRIKAAPHAAGGGGGTMIPVCNECDPLPVMITAAMLKAYEAGAKALADMHKAADLLMAMLATRDKTFLPSKSAAWPAVVASHEALVALREVGAIKES